MGYFPFFIILTTFFIPHCSAGLLTEPVEPSNTVPAIPVQTDPKTCHLDLSDELFGGVSDACSGTLDRSRCCPVLAAWLFAAHARSALQISPSPSPAPAVLPSEESSVMPMMPDDAQKCVNSLQSALQKRKIKLAQPNATCDTVLCFCGIRLHQITSLSCPAAFNVTAVAHRNATPTAVVKNLEKSCRNSSYAGCTKCLGALQKVKGDHSKKGTKEEEESREKRIMSRDCQLMGLTWLLAHNKTTFIPTVSAVLRALLYSAHPHDTKCSPDQDNMPLAVDSLQFDYHSLASPPSHAPLLVTSLLLVLRFVVFLLL